MDPQKELELLAEGAKAWKLKDALNRFGMKLRGLVWKEKTRKKNIEEINDLIEKEDDNVSLGSQDSWNM